MKRVIFILTAVLMTAGIIYGEKTEMLTEGGFFPELVFERADGNVFVFPEDKKDGITLLVITFSRPEEGMTESWFLPFKNEFKGYEKVNYYEIAMLGNLGWLQGLITGAIKGSVKEDRKNNFMLYLGDKKDEFAEKMNMDNNHPVYIFLTEQQGRIVYMTKGGKAEEQDIKNLFKKTYEILKK